MTATLSVYGPPPPPDEDADAESAPPPVTERKGALALVSDALPDSGESDEEVLELDQTVGDPEPEAALVLEDEVADEAAPEPEAALVLEDEVDDEPAPEAEAALVLEDEVADEAAPEAEAALVLEDEVDAEAAPEAEAALMLEDEVDAEAAPLAEAAPEDVASDSLVLDREAEPDADFVEEPERAPAVEPEPIAVPVPPPAVIPEKTQRKRSVLAKRPVKPGSLTRKNRWRRRGDSKVTRRIIGLIAGVVLFLAAIVAVRLMSGPAVIGPEGAFAQAVYEAFPEADPQRIETVEDGDVPLSATLHLPAHLIEPALGSDPFARLGSEFGGAERTLSGQEMGARIEQIAQTMLPQDMIRCHTYEVGGISSEPESPRQTRALFVRLNPGC